MKDFRFEVGDVVITRRGVEKDYFDEEKQYPGIIIKKFYVDGDTKEQPGYLVNLFHHTDACGQKDKMAEFYYDEDLYKPTGLNALLGGPEEFTRSITMDKLMWKIERYIDEGEGLPEEDFLKFFTSLIYKK